MNGVTQRKQLLLKKATNSLGRNSHPNRNVNALAHLNRKIQVHICGFQSNLGFPQPIHNPVLQDLFVLHHVLFDMPNRN